MIDEYLRNIIAKSCTRLKVTNVEIMENNGNLHSIKGRYKDMSIEIPNSVINKILFYNGKNIEDFVSALIGRFLIASNSLEKKSDSYETGGEWFNHNPDLLKEFNVKWQCEWLEKDHEESDFSRFTYKKITDEKIYVFFNNNAIGFITYDIFLMGVLFIPIRLYKDVVL